MNEAVFKDNILEWNELKDSSKQFSDGLKKVRDRLKILQDENIKYMTSKDLDACTVEDGTISLRRTTRKVVDVKRSNLPEILMSFYMDVEKKSNHDAEIIIDKFVRYIEKYHSKSTESLSLIKTYKK